MNKTPKKKALRQSMAVLHGWTGLLCSILLYAMFLTGTVSYFKEELTQWMRPELQISTPLPEAADIAQRISDRFTNTPQWSIRMPDDRNPTVEAFWRSDDTHRRFDHGLYDPHTAEDVQVRDTKGGVFFYQFHYQFHYLPALWGRWLAGIAAMFMLIAIVSGIIVHKKIFADFFTFRWGKGQRSWLDAHNAVSVFGLPFHLMITYTGLVTLMALYMPWGQNIAIQSPQERQEMRAELSAFISPAKATGIAAPLAPIDQMVRQAQAHWDDKAISRITVTNTGDQAALVSIARGNSSRVSMSPQFLLFEGSTGRLLQHQDHVGAAAELRGILYGLHLGRFSDTVTRWLYFFVSLLGTAMVGSGMVLWTVKRRQRLKPTQRPSLGLQLMERSNIATIAGLSLAMTAYLWANRLLPLQIPYRATTEISLFFLIWGLSLVHASFRNPRKAWLEQLSVAAAALFALPLINMFTTSRSWWQSLQKNDWVFFSADMLFIGLAAIHAYAAYTLFTRKK